MTSYYILMALAFLFVLIVPYRWVRSIRRKRDADVVEIDAECIDLSFLPQSLLKERPELVHYAHARVPIYKYRFEGKEYISAIVFQLGPARHRRGLGPCRIKIHAKDPMWIVPPGRGIQIGLQVILLALAAAALIIVFAAYHLLRQNP